MTCGTHSDSNDKTPPPYHVLVVYLVEDDGSLGGGFYIKPMGFGGGIAGRSLEEFRNECYESLATGITASDNIPFDTTDLRKSVVFDFVECLNEGEYDLAEQMEKAEDTFENIIEAIQQLRLSKIDQSAAQDTNDPIE